MEAPVYRKTPVRKASKHFSPGRKLKGLFPLGHLLTRGEGNVYCAFPPCQIQRVCLWEAACVLAAKKVQGKILAHGQRKRVGTVLSLAGE